jgi:hypothetical protein
MCPPVGSRGRSEASSEAIAREQTKGLWGVDLLPAFIPH